MKGLFNYDNGLFRGMEKLGNLFFLNLLTIICCIPIFTIGTSFTALYYVCMKMTKDEETYIAKDFFRSFRQNFRQATIIWMIFLILGLMLVTDYRLVSLNREVFPAADVFIVLIMACGVIYTITLAYVFPVLAKFYNTVKQTIKNAVIMGIRHFPYTLAIVFIDVAFILITAVGLIRNGRSFLAPLYICLGFSVPAYANAYLFERIFKHYIPDTEGEETGSDEEFIARLQSEDRNKISDEK